MATNSAHPTTTVTPPRTPGQASALDELSREDIVRAHALVQRARRQLELIGTAALALVQGGEGMVADDGPIDLVMLGDALHETAHDAAAALNEALLILPH